VCLHFTSPGEFIAELRRRPPNVEPVVRVTFRWTIDPSGLPAQHLSVLAGYLRLAGSSVLILHLLSHYAGQVWPGIDEPGSQQARERARRARELIQQAARDAGLEPCAGAYGLPGLVASTPSGTHSPPVFPASPAHREAER
jgi:hypothetical protein